MWAIVQEPGTVRGDRLLFEGLFQDITYDGAGNVSGILGIAVPVVDMPGADQFPED